VHRAVIGDNDDMPSSWDVPITCRTRGLGNVTDDR
jgi:hypothetical protein